MVSSQLTLLSATPSPYARKVRIVLLEKKIPFTLRTEVPWDSTTECPAHNPLEKLPVLLFDDGSHPPVFESSHILEWLEEKYADQGPRFMPEDVDERLKAKQVQIVADGVCDAMGLAFFEKSRGERMSPEWHARQWRKVQGGVKACAEYVKESAGGEYIVGDMLTVADLAVVSMLGMLDMVGEVWWKEQYPELEKYWKRLEERESFQKTKPYMFEIKDRVA